MDCARRPAIPRHPSRPRDPLSKTRTLEPDEGGAGRQRHSDDDNGIVEQREGTRPILRPALCRRLVELAAALIQRVRYACWAPATSLRKTPPYFCHSRYPSSSASRTGEACMNLGFHDSKAFL